MDNKKDFFFGEYYDKDGDAVFFLHKLEELVKKVSPAFLTRQLNRFLTELNASRGPSWPHARLIVSDGTSHPSFWHFIDSIEPSSVGFIEIYARMDINTNLKATLACDIVMDQGVVSVVPHWCAHKDIRAGEIVSTLLVPLHLKGLHTRSFLRWDDGKTERLSHGMDWGYEDELKTVFKLSKYPSAGTPLCDDDRRRFHENTQDLKLASQVGGKNLSGEAAWDALRELRKEASSTEQTLNQPNQTEITDE